MGTNSNRSYNCKNEELPVICRYTLFSLKRDLADFTAYSPKLNDAYASAYETKIATAEELVSPKSETAEKKKITDRITASMAALIAYTNHLNGYLEMANGKINLSATNFGLTALRKGIAAHDPEKVIDRLKDVIKNISKYREDLTEQGFTDALLEKLTGTYASLIADRQTQYELLANRKALVQKNVSVFNDLYNQLQEVCRIGKILYAGVDPVKVKEYTFTELKKQGGRSSKNTEAASEENNSGTTN